MKLIFTYNADRGLANTIKDITHKLLSPQTYDCFLCSFTHDTFRENQQWKHFREHSNCDMEFLHRDEFEKQYNQKKEYPVVLVERERSLEVAVSKDTLATYSSLNDLIERIEKLEEVG